MEMISLEEFYENQVQGKSEAEILKCIDDLKKEIKENVDKEAKNQILTFLFREYVHMAELELDRRGANYQRDAVEKRSQNFNNRLEDLVHVSFYLNVRHDLQAKDTDVYEIDLQDPFIQYSFANKYYGGVCQFRKVLDKSEFIGNLKLAYMGEWKASYMDESLQKDPSWQLELTYRNGEVFKNGGNTYPYNFDDLVYAIKDFIYEENITNY